VSAHAVDTSVSANASDVYSCAKRNESVDARSNTRKRTERTSYGISRSSPVVSSFSITVSASRRRDVRATSREMSRKMRRQSEHERLGGLDDDDDASDDDDDDDDAWYRTRTRETSQAMKRAVRDMRDAGAAAAAAASSEAVKTWWLEQP